MAPSPATPLSLTVHDAGAGRVLLSGEGTHYVLIGYDGPRLPARLEAAVLEPTGPGAWRLRARDALFDFHVLGIEKLRPQPRLFDGLLAPFTLKPRDRALVGVLLRLLRLPGGAWLLRRWHARRK